MLANCTLSCIKLDRKSEVLDIHKQFELLARILMSFFTVFTVGHIKISVRQ